MMNQPVKTAGFWPTFGLCVLGALTLPGCSGSREKPGPDISSSFRDDKLGVTFRLTRIDIPGKFDPIKSFSLEAKYEGDYTVRFWSISDGKDDTGKKVKQLGEPRVFTLAAGGEIENIVFEGSHQPEDLHIVIDYKAPATPTGPVPTTFTAEFEGHKFFRDTVVKVEE